MQKDFHFYCIGVLSKAAGFKSEDALTIAYASQYVDNSTESEPIQFDSHIFDPVRTAHYGLRAYDWSVQKRIFIPFHFLPSNPIISTTNTYITEPNSNFARSIINEAINENNGTMRLYRIGIALHTFADTWAHQGFSGREHEENNVEKIQLFKGNSWKRLLWENFYLDLLPQIGHAEAGYHPDQPFQIWKYKRIVTKKTVKRNNLNEFFNAAETIYTILHDIEKPASDEIIPWDVIKRDIYNLLKSKESDVNKRCDKWRKKFQYLFKSHDFNYNKLTWRNKAVKPKGKATTDWDDYEPSYFKNIQFTIKPGFYESSWVYFHRAAMRQRHFVLENLL